MEEHSTLKEKCKRLWPNRGAKWKYSLYSALVFFIVASLQAYRISSRVIGDRVAVDGCPRPLGLFLHSGLFMVALYGLMNLPD